MSTKTEWGSVKSSERGSDKYTEKYQAGEPYADTETSMTGLLEDLKAIGRENAHKDISTLLKVLTTAGKPIDDREMMVFPSKPNPSVLLVDSSTDGTFDRSHSFTPKLFQSSAQVIAYNSEKFVGDRRYRP
jgi:hypothetical protein